MFVLMYNKRQKSTVSFELALLVYMLHTY